jgi:hypothetical protein
VSTSRPGSPWRKLESIATPGRPEVLANGTAGTGPGRIKREPVPLDDPILIVFRLPAAFERPEPADREEAKSARVAIKPKAIPSMSASQGVSWRISELL